VLAPSFFTFILYYFFLELIISCYTNSLKSFSHFSYSLIHQNSLLVSPILWILNLKFKIIFLNLYIPLNLFLEVILSITYLIHNYLYHLFISFHIKFPICVEVLLPLILYLHGGLHRIYMWVYTWRVVAYPGAIFKRTRLEVTCS
jgi:hypothetical protein